MELESEPRSFRFCQAPPHLDRESSASNQLVKRWQTLIHLGSSLHDSLGIKNRPIKTQSNDDGCLRKNIPELNKQIWFEGSWAWFVVSVYLGLYPGASDLSSWHSTSPSHSSTSDSTYQERGTSFHSHQCHTINKGANFKNKRFFQQLARMFKNLSPAIAWKIIHWCFLFCVGFLSKSCFLLLSQNYFESVIENILVTQKGWRVNQFPTSYRPVQRWAGF